MTAAAFAGGPLVDRRRVAESLSDEAIQAIEFEVAAVVRMPGRRRAGPASVGPPAPRAPPRSPAG
jgi:hypothetical protein